MIAMAERHRPAGQLPRASSGMTSPAHYSPPDGTGPRSHGTATVPDGATGPVIVLSYSYAGAATVQGALAADDGLACTSGTGIIALCAAAAQTWRHVEGRDDRQAMSRMAAVSVRGLVTAQVTVILASAGKTRWCELATAVPGAAETFLRVLPHANVVCVHRSCLDVVRAGIQASPWGLTTPSLAPYVRAYPGNSVAALAAYWVNSASQLLAFEEANRDRTHRVRYEDVAAEPDEALAAVRASLGLGGGPACALPGPLQQADTALPVVTVPPEMIPEPLRRRINDTHTQLGYPVVFS